MRKHSAGPLLSTLALTTFLMVSPALAANDLAQRFTDAKSVYQELMAAPDRAVPKELLENAKCIAVIPHVIKGALGYGARFGRGVMSCKSDAGWSSPTFITLSGASAGLQIGFESTDLVLFFMTERGARSLLTGSKVTLGGKLSVAAGPFGRSGEASTDLKLNAEIYSYAKSKGLFAGISLEGARLATDTKSNRQYYGQALDAKQLLFDHVATQGAEADDFRKALP